MRIRTVNTLADLNALRDDWRRLHSQDAQATVFTSWPWLSAWAAVSPYPWSVLTARDEGSNDLLGLFPTSFRGSRAGYRLDQLREVHAMGDPAADYRGLICDHARQEDVVRAFADHFAADRQWDRLLLKDVLDDRLSGFIARLREREATVDVEENDGNACPLLALPATWEAYLSECLTQPSRKSLKKRLRIADEHAARLTTTTNEGEVSRHLEVLFQLCGKQGKNTPEHLQRSRTVLETCLSENCAEIAVVWVRDEPAAAQGSFIDWNKRSIGHYLTGYDDRFADLSPGRVLDALCIRSAIERGFKAVDFLRGDEPYKHQLGARPRFTRHAFFTRHGAVRSLRASISRWRDRLGG